MKIKDIPNDDRPYERCQREGPERLSDVELLSIIIRTGSRDSNSLELAADILALNYPKDGILGLLQLTLPELMSIKGIGKVKGIQLLCVGELSRRIWKRKTREKKLIFQSPQEVAEYFQEDMRHADQELFYLMLFNTKQSLIRDIQLPLGDGNPAYLRQRGCSTGNHHTGRLALHYAGDQISLRRHTGKGGLHGHLLGGQHRYLHMHAAVFFAMSESSTSSPSAS